MLLFPAAFLIALWTLQLTAEAARRRRLLLAMACMTFAGWVFFSTIPVNPDAYSWLWMKAAWRQDASLQEIDRKFHLSQEPEMLFLAPGDVNYVIRAKCSMRYMAPVILQRAASDKSLRDTELFQRLVKEALAYHGTYIYLSDWLTLDHLPQLEAKLKTEYEPATEKIPQFYPLCDFQLFKRRCLPTGTDK